MHCGSVPLTRGGNALQFSHCGSVLCNLVRRCCLGRVTCDCKVVACTPDAQSKYGTLQCPLLSPFIVQVHLAFLLGFGYCILTAASPVLLCEHGCHRLWTSIAGGATIWGFSFVACTLRSVQAKCSTRSLYIRPLPYVAQVAEAAPLHFGFEV